MQSGRQIDAALRGLRLVTVNQTWWRAVAHHLLNSPPPGAPPGSAPQPLWPDGSSRFGARFTPKGGPPAVYLASDPQTALQEVGAVFAIPKGPPIALPAPPYTLCQVHVVLTEVLDTRDAATQKALRTSTQELTGDWRYTMGQRRSPPTHILGRAAHSSGCIAAIMAHSSKNVGGGLILAVFPDRLSNPNLIEVIDPTGFLRQRFP
jgi:RES domain-containing protein